MLSDLLTGGSAIAALYLFLVAPVALIASLHPDPDHRRDAREVLDRLLNPVHGGRRR